jgi:DNA-directed RNA polymerase specialized sigma24 family protein
MPPAGPPERPSARVGDEVLALLDDGRADAELALMRTRYAEALAGALTQAWAALPPHDRFVLDLELRQRLGVDEIARVYDVQRGTALRRLASARAALVAGTRAALRAELRVGEATLDSVLRVVSTSARWAALPGG